MGAWCIKIINSKYHLMTLFSSVISTSGTENNTSVYVTSSECFQSHCEPKVTAQA